MSTDFNRVSKTISTTVGSAESKRAEIKSYFNQTFELYEKLFELISNHKAYYKRAEPLRHPLIFYFGHTATFFMNKLVLGNYITKRINPKFESMFAVGVDEMSWDDLDERNYDWPQVSEVIEYRKKVKSLVNQFIDDMPLQLPLKKEDPAWVVLMGIEHERIHLETSSVIIRMLDLADVKPHSLFTPCFEKGQHPANQLISIPEQKIRLGKPEGDPTFGWDNEYGVKFENVKEFKASSFLVSNGEYLEFVQEEGYSNPKYWTPEGKKWLAYTQAKHPRFWSLKKNKYFQRNLVNEMELPLNWPVEVNYLEAKAFCEWKSEKNGKSIRLPTEPEYMVLREKVSSDMLDWQEAPGNINLEYFASSCPVDHFKTGDFYDIIGNVWQWTETPIDGYPGFQVHPLYDDFSTPTFDGKHNLIKGGSWISTGNEALKHSRYAFRRHFFQHAGLRYVEAERIEMENEVNVYESDKLVSEYLEFHYGDSYFGVDNFPKSCIDQIAEFIQSTPKERALDIGCAVGRSTFELAKHFDHVDGIDFSARFIGMGHRLQEKGLIRYTIPTEGDLVEYKGITLKTLGHEESAKRAHFVQGDACNLKEQFKDYDLVFAGNLLDRLYDPALFLDKVTQLIRSNGYLVLTSPYTWLEEHTKKENWPGGFKKDGEDFFTLDGLKQLLANEFELVATKDIPFVIRETRRKFQHTVSEMSVWKKK